MIKYFYKERNITSPPVERPGEVYSVIGKGAHHSISGYYNTVSGVYSTIGGGAFNVVSGYCSFIGGGVGNMVSNSNSFIGGGYQNTVSGPCGSVVGGSGNTVSGAYSSILGGSGNTINAAYQYAGVFGQNVNAIANNTFHVECLNAINTPLILGPYPVGTIFASSMPPSASCALPLYIRI